MSLMIQTKIYLWLKRCWTKHVYESDNNPHIKQNFLYKFKEKEERKSGEITKILTSYLFKF